MSSPKPLPKVPVKQFKVNGRDCSEAEFNRYHAEMRMLAQVEHQMWKVCREGMRPWRRW